MRIPRPAVYAFLAAVLVMAVAVAVALLRGPEILVLAFKDANSITNVSPLYGVISSLGGFAWAITGGITLFVALIVRRRGERLAAQFLFAGSALSFYTGIDDFFMIHDGLAEHFLGLSEKYPFIFLGVSVTAYIYWFRGLIRQMAWPFLALAILSFFGSVSFDTIFEWYGKFLGGWSYIFEDGPKWFGIIFWAIFHIDAAHELLVNGEPKAD